MNYRTIRQIAAYEIKLLGRDRILMGILCLSVLLIAFIHIITQSNFTSPAWFTIAMPSAIPFTNAYMVNLLQTLVIIFWAGHSIREEQRADSFPSISVRPFSNAEWLAGKVAGFLSVILLFDIVAAGTAMCIHLFSSDSPFAFFPYVFYFFTLSMPTVVFVTGMSLFVKSVLKKKFLAQTCLLAIFYPGTVLLANRLHGISDLFLLEMPNTLSEVTGMAQVHLYFLQRSAFFLSGCGLLIAGIRIITRLPDSRKSYRQAGWLYLPLIATGIILATLYLLEQERTRQYRKRLREVFVKHEGMPKARTTEHSIMFEQAGETYHATSTLQIHNPHRDKLPCILLYLNPGLEVDRLTGEGREVAFEREEQVIIIPESLAPGGSREFTLQYHGSITPEVCYAEIEDLDVLYKLRQYYHFNAGTDFHYLREDFTLLTPECLWYPTALSPVNVSSPVTTIQSYTKFQLTIIGEKERTPVSQGTSTRQGDTISFANEMPLPGISLCIGKYTRRQLPVNGVQFEAYILQDHEDFLPELPKQFPMVLQSWLQDLDRQNQAYAFNKLAMIEVPVNYCAYARTWKTGSEYVQPEMIFRPEREALSTQGIKIPEKASIPVLPPEVEWFSKYTRAYSSSRTIHAGFPVLAAKEEYTSNEYNLSDLLQKHHVQITSPEFPGIQRVFQKMQTLQGSVLYSYNDNPSHEDATGYFTNHRLLDIFQKPQEALHFNRCLTAKSITFLTRILYSISPKRFQNFMEDFYTKHAFSEVDYNLLCNEVQATDSLDLLALTQQLYHEKGLPDFRVRDALVQRVENSSREIGYLQSVKVWNRGTVDGMITLTGSHFNQNIYYLIPAGACKELKTYIPEEPNKFSLQVQTNLAHNIPAFYNFKNQEPVGTVKDATTGMFNIDTLPFTNAPGEFIVDNEDDGFRILEPRQALTRLADHQHWMREYDYDANCHGEPVKSYHVRLAGQGNTCVEWATNLPKEGTYELFVYHEEKLFSHNGHIRQYINQQEQTATNPTQTYQFTHANGEESITIETLQAGFGWVSLGKFPFAAGEAKIKLLDLGSSPYQAIIGDAVKWKRVK